MHVSKFLKAYMNSGPNIIISLEKQVCRFLKAPRFNNRRYLRSIKNMRAWGILSAPYWGKGFIGNKLNTAHTKKSNDLEYFHYSWIFHELWDCRNNPSWLSVKTCQLPYPLRPLSDKCRQGEYNDSGCLPRWGWGQEESSSCVLLLTLGSKSWAIDIVN